MGMARRGLGRVLLVLVLLTGAGATTSTATAQTPTPPSSTSPPASEPPPAAATAVTPEQALARLFGDAPLESGWFSEEMLRAVPLARLQQLVDSLRHSHGALLGVRADGQGRWLVELERGWVPSRLTLDPQGRFAGLFFEPPLARAASLDAQVASLTQLPGQVGLLITENGSDRFAHEADRPMAVGSAFKMLVLRVLADQIAAGQRSWADVVPLAPEWRSGGGTPMERWPVGEPVTLSTLAIFMIAVSDNTAADGLLAVLGRETLEAAAPPRNRPFPSTREMFLLRFGGETERAARYHAGDEAARRQILGELAGMPIPATLGASGVTALPEMGWFFTARELCTLIGQVEALPAMRVNPGPAVGLGWATAAFKGGAEPGVINLTSFVTDDHGRRFCVAATWNNEAGVDDAQFTALFRSVLAALR